VPRRAAVRDASEVGPADSLVLSSEGRGWRGVGAALFHTRFDGILIPPPANHMVSVVLNRVDLAMEWEGHKSRTPAGKGSTLVLPAGLAYEARWEGRERLKVFHAHPEPSFVGEVAAEAGADPEHLEILPRLLLRDERLERLALSFLAELEGGGLGGELYAESLARALAVQLLRGHSSLGERARRKVTREPEGGLSKRALGRAFDFIGDNLSGEISLADVAGAAGYSPRHFSRLFRESTGLSPHQYVIRGRVERAKGLLLGGMPAGQAARAGGFHDQSHLTRHFKAVLGVTPGRLLQDGGNVQGDGRILQDPSS